MMAAVMCQAVGLDEGEKEVEEWSFRFYIELSSIVFKERS